MKFYNVLCLGLFLFLTSHSSFSQESFKGIKSLVYLPETDEVEVYIKNAAPHKHLISRLESSALSPKADEINKCKLAIEAFGADTIGNLKVQSLNREIDSLNIESHRLMKAYRNLFAVFSGYEKSSDSKVFWKAMGLLLDGKIDEAQQQITKQLLKIVKMSFGESFKEEEIRNYLDLLYLSASISQLQGDDAAAKDVIHILSVEKPSLISYLYVTNYYNLIGNKYKANTFCERAFLLSNFAVSEEQDITDRLKLLSLMGANYMLTENFSSAANMFKVLLEKYDASNIEHWYGPDMDIIRLYLSVCYYETGEYDLAEKEFCNVMPFIISNRVYSFSNFSMIINQFEFVLKSCLISGDSEMFENVLMHYDHFLDDLQCNWYLSELSITRLRYYAYEYLCNLSVNNLLRENLPEGYLENYYAKAVEELQLLKELGDTDAKAISRSTILCKGYEGILKFDSVDPQEKRRAIECLDTFYQYGLTVNEDHFIAYVLRESSFCLLEYYLNQNDNEKAKIYIVGLLKASEEMFSFDPQNEVRNYTTSCKHAIITLLKSNLREDWNRGVEIAEFGLDLAQDWFSKTNDYQMLSQCPNLCNILLDLNEKLGDDEKVCMSAITYHKLSDLLYQNNPEFWYDYQISCCDYLPRLILRSKSSEDLKKGASIAKNGIQLIKEWYKKTGDISLLYKGCEIYRVLKYYYMYDIDALVANNKEYLALAQMIPSSDYMEWKRLLELAYAYESLGRALMDNDQCNMARTRYEKGLELLKIIKDNYYNQLSSEELQTYERLYRILPAIIDHLDKRGYH